MIRTAIINTKAGKVEFVLMMDSPTVPPGFSSDYIAVASDVVNIGWLWDGANLTAPAALPPAPDQVRIANFMAEPDRVDLITRLTTATPAQIDSFIDAQVTTLPAARAVLKAILKVIAVTTRN